MVIFFCGVLIIIKMYKSTYTFAIPGQGSLLKEKVEADRDSLLKDASTLQSEEQNNLNSKPQWVPEDYCHPVSEHFQTTESFLSCNWAETDLPKCKYRMKASLQCSGDASPRVVLRIVPSDTPPDRLAFNDSCLLSVVRSSLCKEKGMRVPRVSIYTHLGKNNLPFYWFLSVLSVVRSFRTLCGLVCRGLPAPRKSVGHVTLHGAQYFSRSAGAANIYFRKPSKSAPAPQRCSSPGIFDRCVGWGFFVFCFLSSFFFPPHIMNKRPKPQRTYICTAYSVRVEPQ